MTDTAPAPAASTSSSSAPSRGGHRSRGARRGGGPNRAPRVTPAADSSAPPSDSSAPASQPSSSSGRGGRGRGGASGSRRGGRGGARAGQDGAESAPNGQPPANASSRRSRFNGGLSSGKAALAATAPAFPAPAPAAPAPVAAAPASQTLLDRLTHELCSGESDCPICFNSLSKTAQISSCSTCFTPFHLTCLTKWAQTSVAQSAERAALLADRGTQSSRPSPKDLEGSWRCPGCNAPFTASEVPTKYRCFCGRVANPQHRPPATPHSCGTQCSRARPTGCSHPCALLCHPGPCPPCNVVLELDCHCHKERKAVRCSALNKPATGAAATLPISELLSCGQACGRMLDCGLHACEKACHDGDCGSCEEVRTKQCFCGADSAVEACGVRPAIDRTECAKPGTEESWTGEYSCGKACEVKYDCGNHTCTSTICHPHQLTAPPCPFAPERVSTCPCGQTQLSTLLPSPRASCTSPIPTCKKTCPRILDCGHQCTRPCHAGECGSCLTPVTVTCRCASHTTRRQCGERKPDGSPLDEFLCERVCKALRSCAKHECNRRCCPLSFQEAYKAKGKGRGRLPDYLPEEDPMGLHQCPIVCGKRQGCGQHTCPQPCHRGPCPPCLLAGFDEVVCHCGSTVAMPPLPCNFVIDCRAPCIRPPPCGHPQMPHACHETAECPPCPFLMTKPCACGKKTVPNVRCSQDQARVSCGTPCGKLLRCGYHRCKQVCHQGECPDVCDQMCLKPRRLCGHPCPLPCHFPSSCSVDRPCEKLIEVSCTCGRTKQQAKCGACTDKPEGNKGRLIKCTPQCEIARRNAALAEALGIEKVGPKVKEVEYLPLILDFYAANVAWATTIEQQLTEFVAAEDAGKRPSLHFPVMRRPQRQFVHELAEFFDLRSESLDEEPRRSVVVHRTSNCGVPTPTLADALAAQKKSSAVTLNLGSLRKALPEKKVSNALYLENVLGYEESELKNLLRPHMRGLVFEVTWKTEEDVLVTFPNAVSEFATKLAAIQHALRTLVEDTGFCSAVESVAVNEAGEVARGGWATVTGSGATSRARSGASTPVASTSASRWGGHANAFGALGTSPPKVKPLAPTANAWRAPSLPAAAPAPVAAAPVVAVASVPTVRAAAPAFVPRVVPAAVEPAAPVRSEEDVPDDWEADEQ